MILIGYLAELHRWDIGAIASASEPGPRVGHCTSPVGFLRDVDLKQNRPIRGRECLDQTRLAKGLLAAHQHELVRGAHDRARDRPSRDETRRDPSNNGS